MVGFTNFISSLRFKFNRKAYQQQLTYRKENINSNVKKAMQQVAPRLAEKVRETFKLKGAREGRPQWLITRNPTPLIKTGALMRSVRGYVLSQNNKYIMTIATPKDYAKKHDQGIGFPKRQFMFLTRNDQILINNMIGYYLKENQ